MADEREYLLNKVRESEATSKGFRIHLARQLRNLVAECMKCIEADDEADEADEADGEANKAVIRFDLLDRKEG